MLPQNDEDRKKYPIWDYLFKYFPDALLAKVKHSYESNLKHNGEEGAKWAEEKSIGDGNQIMRHMFDSMDAAFNSLNRKEAIYHMTALAWRADELLQRMIQSKPPFEHLLGLGMSAIDIEDEANTTNAGGDMDANPSKEPTEDNEVLCGTDDSVSRGILRAMYQKYLAETKAASGHGESSE